MKIYSENCTKKAMYLKSKKMENTDLKKTPYTPFKTSDLAVLRNDFTCKRK